MKKSSFYFFILYFTFLMVTNVCATSRDFPPSFVPLPWNEFVYKSVELETFGTTTVKIKTDAKEHVKSISIDVFGEIKYVSSKDLKNVDRITPLTLSILHRGSDKEKLQVFFEFGNEEKITLKPSVNFGKDYVKARQFFIITIDRSSKMKVIKLHPSEYLDPEKDVVWE